MTQNFLYPASYVYDPRYTKLKLRVKFNFKLWVEGLRHAMISNYSFVSCKHYSMVYEKHFTHYRYDTNFLYPTCMYDITETETKGSKF